MPRFDDLNFNVGANTAGAEAGFGRIAHNIGAITGLLQGLRQSAGGALAALGAFQIIQGYIRLNDEMVELNNQLRLVSSGVENFAFLRDELFDIAQTTRTGLAETVNLYARISRSSRDLNLTDAQRLLITERINKSLQISGATTQETVASTIQIGQALASNRLAGDEFRSVMENAPRIAQALADHLGVGLGNLRAMSIAGKLTADVVTEALLAATSIDEEFEDVEVSISKAATTLSNSTLEFVESFNEFTRTDDQIIGFLTLLREAVELLTDAYRLAAEAREALIGQTADFVQGRPIPERQDIQISRFDRRVTGDVDRTIQIQAERVLERAKLVNNILKEAGNFLPIEEAQRDYLEQVRALTGFYKTAIEQGNDQALDLLDTAIQNIGERLGDTIRRLTKGIEEDAADPFLDTELDTPGAGIGGQLALRFQQFQRAEDERFRAQREREREAARAAREAEREAERAQREAERRARRAAQSLRIAIDGALPEQARVNQITEDMALINAEIERLGAEATPELGQALLVLSEDLAEATRLANQTPAERERERAAGALAESFAFNISREVARAEFFRNPARSILVGIGEAIQEQAHATLFNFLRDFFKGFFEDLIARIQGDTANIGVSLGGFAARFLGVQQRHGGGPITGDYPGQEQLLLAEAGEYVLSRQDVAVGGLGPHITLQYNAQGNFDEPAVQAIQRNAPAIANILYPQLVEQGYIR